MHRKRKALSTILAAVFLVVIPGRVMASDLLKDPRLAEINTELATILDGATEKGLPTDLLEAKIREGLVKKVAAPKILTAVSKLQGQCEKASALLVKSGVAPATKEIALVVTLAQAGLTDKDAQLLLSGLVTAKLDSAYREKALLITLAITEKGTPSKDAVTKVLGIVKANGKKGLDGWGKKSKSGKGKGKAKPKGPSKGKGKAKGKPNKPHAK